MAPTFLIRVDEMRPKSTSGYGQSVDSWGRWTPPKAAGGNEIVTIGTTGNYYFCNGQEIVRTSWPTDPASTPTHFKTYSVYFHEDTFIIANGDAAYSQVGDGRAPQNETTEDSEEDSEEDYTGPVSNGWYRMAFSHGDNYVSHVCYDAEPRKLSFQHSGQPWVRMLFPSTYFAEFESQPSTQGYGGLTGDLPLFLALIIFSVPETWGDWALTSLFRRARWTTHTHPHGRNERRGMVVRVWSFPPSSNADLINLENGVHGKFYY